MRLAIRINYHKILFWSTKFKFKCNTVEEANEREIFWIAEFNCKAPNGYNLTDGGGGTSGRTLSDDVKKQIAKSLMGHEVADFTKDKISTSLTIYFENPKARENQSVAQLKRFENK